MFLPLDCSLFFVVVFFRVLTSWCYTRKVFLNTKASTKASKYNRTFFRRWPIFQIPLTQNLICYLWTQWRAVFTVNSSLCYLAFALMSLSQSCLSWSPRAWGHSCSVEVFTKILCVRLLLVLSPRICTFEIALGRNPTKMCSNSQITAERNVSVVCYMHITHMCTNFLILIQMGRSLCYRETLTSDFSYLESPTQVNLGEISPLSLLLWKEVSEQK